MAKAVQKEVEVTTLVAAAVAKRIGGHGVDGKGPISQRPRNPRSPGLPLNHYSSLASFKDKARLRVEGEHSERAEEDELR